MKSTFLQCMGAISLIAAAVVPAPLAAQTYYSVVELAGLGGTAGGANSINDRGWVTGSDNLAGDTTSIATLWLKGLTVPLGTLGGPNSAVAWPVKSNAGKIVGISETADMNPLAEDWSCSAFFPTFPPDHHICLGFVWKQGVMSPLPTLGGYNGYAAAANNRGQIVGWAENTVVDPTCVSPQVLQFRAVIWGPRGEIEELPPLPGDSTSAATAINDYGQVVGISGDCGLAVGGVSARHAVLWENGFPIDLGNIGGDAWNTATAINNQGTIVGFANRAPGIARTYEAFIWTKTGGMKSLGKFSGDLRSAAFGINEKGQVVGLSVGGGPFGIRPVLWENNLMTDLNALTLTGSPYLLLAGDINANGQIVGEAFDSNTGEAPAYIATPTHSSNAASSELRKTPQGNLPDHVQQQIERRLGLGSFGIDPITPQ